MSCSSARVVFECSCRVRVHVSCTSVHVSCMIVQNLVRVDVSYKSARVVQE